MNVKDFKKVWERLGNSSELVQTLDKNDGDPDAFESYHQEFLNFMKDEYKIAQPILDTLSIGGVRQRLDAAKLDNYERTRWSVRGLTNNLEDIIDDFEDEDKQKAAFSVIPLKQLDLKEDYDKIKFKKVADSYKDKSNDIKAKLVAMNRTQDPKKYDALSMAAKEYEGFSKLIKDNEDFVKKAVKYRQLVSHAIGERGRPDSAKMKEIFDKYLDKLKTKYTSDSNQIALNVIGELANDERYLGNYYGKSILEPAETELKETDLANDNKKLTKYVKDGVDAMGINRKFGFFEGIYGLAA